METIGSCWGCQRNWWLPGESPNTILFKSPLSKGSRAALLRKWARGNWPAAVLLPLRRRTNSVCLGQIVKELEQVSGARSQGSGKHDHFKPCVSSSSGVFPQASSLKSRTSSIHAPSPKVESFFVVVRCVQVASYANGIIMSGSALAAGLTRGPIDPPPHPQGTHSNRRSRRQIPW